MIDELIQEEDLQDLLADENLVVIVTKEALADAMSCNSNSGGGCGRSGSCGSSSCRLGTESSYS